MADDIKPQTKTGCPSCDLDLSSPGAQGHVCYTYAEQADRVERARRAPRPIRVRTAA